MNSSGGKTPSTARPPSYKANALAMIRNELSQFANSGESSSSGQQSPQPPQNQQVELLRFLHLASNSPFPLHFQPSAQSIEREVLLIRQMLSQAGVSGFEVSFDAFIDKPNVTPHKTTRNLIDDVWKRQAQLVERMFMQ